MKKQNSANDIPDQFHELHWRLFFTLRAFWTIPAGIVIFFTAYFIVSPPQTDLILAPITFFVGGAALWVIDYLFKRYIFQSFSRLTVLSATPQIAEAEETLSQPNIAPKANKSRTTQLRFSNEQLRSELRERQQMQRELNERALQQAAVAKLGQSALKGLDLSVLINEAVTLVAQTLDVEYANVAEYIPHEKILLLRGGVGWQQGTVGQASLDANESSQAGYTLQTGEPVVVESLDDDSRFKPSILLKVHRVVAGMTVIIPGREKAFGVLGAHTIKRRTFTEDDIYFLQAVANVLATAIERKENETQLLKRNRELFALQSASTIIMSNLDISHVLEAITTEMAQLLEVESCAFFRWNEGENLISVSAKYPPQSDDTLWSYNLSELPVTKQVFVERRSIQMTVSQADLNPQELAYMERYNLKSRLILPLVSNDQLLGFVEIMDSREERIFQEEEIVLAKLLASQAAGAIGNAQLHSEVNLYLEELTTLNMISQTITSSLDLERTLTIITHHAIRLVGVESASVALYDENQGNLWYAAASGEGEDYIPGKRLELGQGIVGWVIEHDEPLVVTDVSQDARFFDEFDRLGDFATRSILCVPLQTKDRTIGAIQAINKKNKVFDQEDLRVLTTLVAPATTAIVNARLFERSQQEITERKRAEEALQKERSLLAQRVAERTADLQAANLELAQAAKMKDEFLASMSHELRTPLTAILGSCEVLDIQAYGPLNKKQAQTVGNIDQSGRHLLSLINDILDLSKIEAGKLEIERGPMPVKSVSETSLQFVKQLAHKKNIRLSSSFDETVTVLEADERRIKQILVNLLSNAIKFTPQGGSVGLKVVGLPEQKLAQFTVWDTGIGIPEEDISRLFEPFTQLDSSLSRQYAGTGLGLALVSRMIKLHGGSLHVESEVGKGSRFTVSLPWEGPKQIMTTVKPPIDLSKLSTIKRVLILEDSVTMIDLLTRYLQALNMEVVAHATGDGITEKVLAVQPDLVILDLMLPDASGWDVLAGLKDSPTTKDIPVLILSAIDDKPEGLARGADGYLVKPISQQQLTEMLHHIVISKPTSPPPALTPQPVPMPLESYTSNQPLILVTEDDEKISDLFHDYLMAKGYRVQVAHNGLEAIAQVAREQPDLILMDVQMPKMSGLEATRKLRENKDLADMPIIALTARAMAGDREQCLDAGANDYLSKPVNLAQMIKAIETQLG